MKKKPTTNKHAVRHNDLNRLREVYAPYGGQDMGANAVLNLIDEVEYLRKIAAHVPPMIYLKAKEDAATDDKDQRQP